MKPNDINYFVTMEAINRGYLLVDHDKGIVYRTRGSHGKALDEPHAVQYVIKKDYSDGYVVVHLRIDGYNRYIKAHQIVWMSYHNSCIPEGYVIDHQDGNSRNNSISNLKLMTVRENLEKRRSLSGIDVSEKKLTKEDVISLREMYLHAETIVSIARKFNLTESYVSSILNNRAWYDPDWVKPIHKRASKRKSFNPSEVWVEGNLIKIKPNNSDEIYYCDYSEELFRMVQDRGWRSTGKGHLQASVGGKMTPLSHLIVPHKNGMTIDHKNRDVRDNRLCNLRLVDYSTNNLNRKDKRSKTGFSGVSPTKFGTYEAYMNFKGKRYRFGTYRTLEEAVQARLEGEKRVLDSESC